MASVRKLNSGRWIATVRRKGVPSQSRTFKLRSEAVSWASTTDSAVLTFIENSPIQRSRLNVSGLLSWFESTKIPEYRSQRTAVGICCRIKKELGEIQIDTLGSNDIARYRDKRLASGLSGSSVIRELNLLSRAIKLGNIELGLHLPSNPAVDVPRPKANRSRDRRPTQSEICRLIESINMDKQPALKSVIHVALETGMRQGEIIGLKWSDVDLIVGVAIVRESKNGEARQVPLSSSARSAIAALEGLRPDADYADRIFHQWSGTDGLKNAWKRLCTRAGVTGLRFHDLRHEAASRLFERGLNQFQVAAITGHKTLQMLKRYTHLRATELVQLLD